MEVKSAEYLAKHSDELLDNLSKSGTRVLITKDDEAKAVILNYSSYQEINKAFNLLKLLEKSELDYREGRVISHEELKKQMNEKLNQLKEAGCQ